MRSQALILAFAVGVPLIQDPGANVSSPTIDWRSRAAPGTDLLFTFEAQDWSTHPSGGGNLYEWEGTARDVVVDVHEGELLGVRIYTEGQHEVEREAQVTFFTVDSTSRCTEELSLGSLRLPLPMEIPFDQPLSVVADPGSQREVPSTFEAEGYLLEEAVRVQEKVTLGEGEDEGRLVLNREWTSRKKVGEQCVDPNRHLLGMYDECVFDPDDRVILRRTWTRRSRWKSRKMIDGRKTTVREREFLRHGDQRLSVLREEVSTLHRAWLLAHHDPEAALAELDRYDALGSRLVHMAAVSIRAEATGVKAELDAVTDRAVQEGDAAVSRPDAREAIRRGGISFALLQLDLDPEQHDEAFFEREARSGRTQEAMETLRDLHLAGSELMARRPRVEPTKLSKRLEGEAERWLREEVASLRADPPE